MKKVDLNFDACDHINVRNTSFFNTVIPLSCTVCILMYPIMEETLIPQACIYQQGYEMI